MVRAKFYVVSKRAVVFDAAMGTEITMYPVCKLDEDGNNPENEVFGKWTPAGNLSISIVDPNGNYFEEGKEYYLDFTLAEK